MALRQTVRKDRRGAAGAGAGWFAVGLALLLLAAENLNPAAESPEEPPWGIEAAGLLEQEKQDLARLVERAWFGGQSADDDPAVGGRLAVESLREQLASRYPREAGAVRLQIAEPSFALSSLPDGGLPGDLAIFLEGVLQAEGAKGQLLSRPFSVAVPDPRHGRPQQFLFARLEAAFDDPRSVEARALLTRLDNDPRLASRNLDQEAFEVALRDALDGAAAALERELRLAPALEEGEVAPRPGPDRPAEAAPPLAADVAVILNATSDGEFVEFLRAWVARSPLAATEKALIDFLLGQAKGLKDAVRAAALADLHPLHERLSSLGDGARALAATAARILLWAAEEFRGAIAAAAQRAEEIVGWFRPAPLVEPGRPSFISFRAREPRLELLPGGGLYIRNGEVLLPFGGIRVISFVLQADARIPAADGTALRAAAEKPVRLEVPFASPLPVAGRPAAWEERARAILDQFIPAAERIAELLQNLEKVRTQIDSRLFTFREAVSRSILESSASAFSRLLFRVLDAAAEGNTTAAVKGAFDFLERFVAEPLKDALTANFTFLGVRFTLAPDPVRQTVFLFHEEGPHLFGVRLTRLTKEGNPLVHASDVLWSLSLELVYGYRAQDVEAELTIDPLLAREGGLLQFRLRVLSGDGFALKLVAPKIQKLQGTYELALSSFIPGGLVVGVTPWGGLLRMDAGARLEVARVHFPKVARWVLRSLAEAWFDAVANETVREVRDEFTVPPLARSVFGRFLNRMADFVVRDASKILLRAELFLKIYEAEAAGAVKAGFEIGLAVLEPLVVFRELSSGAAAQLLYSRPANRGLSGPPVGLLDSLPTAVHARVGLEAKVFITAGLDALAPLRRGSGPLPAVRLVQGLYTSLGALATIGGRSGVHWVTEYTLSWDGLSAAARAVLPWRLRSADRVDLVAMTVESLSGPKILLSEIHPAPVGNDSDLEYIELYNPSAAEELLTGWSLLDASGHRFAIPEGTRIPPGGTLVIARSAAPFFARFGRVPEVATLRLALNDAGDRITLVNDRQVASDSVAWGPYSPWPRTPAPGVSIARERATQAPFALPHSVLAYTGSDADLRLAPPSPGTLT